MNEKPGLTPLRCMLVTALALLVAHALACGLTALGTGFRLAREAARRSQCNNHLTNLSMGYTDEQLAELQANPPWAFLEQPPDFQDKSAF